jgi:hypothetical protein
MFSPRALALTAAILWGASFLLIGLANLVWPAYGVTWLELGASIYPGYAPGGFGSVIVVTAYATLDGAVVGALFAWIYNKAAGGSRAAV